MVKTYLLIQLVFQGVHSPPYLCNTQILKPEWNILNNNNHNQNQNFYKKKNVFILKITISSHTFLTAVPLPPRRKYAKDEP